MYVFLVSKSSNIRRTTRCFFSVLLSIYELFWYIQDWWGGYDGSLLSSLAPLVGTYLLFWYLRLEDSKFTRTLPCHLYGSEPQMPKRHPDVSVFYFWWYIEPYNIFKIRRACVKPCCYAGRLWFWAYMFTFDISNSIKNSKTSNACKHFHGYSLVSIGLKKDDAGNMFLFCAPGLLLNLWIS